MVGIEEQMDANYSFGYPEECDLCASLLEDGRSLEVSPFFQQGGEFRLMLIGQDPTIGQKPGRVKHVLMLDQPNGQLSRWLKDLIGVHTFESTTIYATNVVKCSFPQKPSSYPGGGLKFLRPFALCCREHLVREVQSYCPDLTLALGEPAHQIFREMLDNPDAIGAKMKGAFSGRFSQVSLGDVSFDYSPCLHITTYRVAETYGSKVVDFRRGLTKRLSQAKK